MTRLWVATSGFSITASALCCTSSYIVIVIVIVINIIITININIIIIIINIPTTTTVSITNKHHYTYIYIYAHTNPSQHGRRSLCCQSTETIGSSLPSDTRCVQPFVTGN